MNRIFFLFFLLLSFFIANKTLAANLILDFSKQTLGAGEQFYVDLKLDTQGQSINAIKGNITFQNDYISFLRVEDGKSMVNLWVEKPNLDEDKNTVNFSGIMTNGFNGVIDPFNTKYKLPGLIIRIIFEAKKPGQVNFSSLPFSLNLNDSTGTEILASPVHGLINIENYVNNLKYTVSSDVSPELDAYITRDSNIYDNKFVLIFNATDKVTGIKDVKIKEGDKNWVEINSPYVLKDQRRHSIIYIQATNYSGVSIVKTIEPLPYRIITPINITIFVFICFLLFFLVKRIYKNKSKIKI